MKAWLNSRGHDNQLSTMALSRLNFLVRSLTTSAARHALVKPPALVFGISGRYATALYSAAHKMGQLEAVEAELTRLQQALRTSRRLGAYIRDPTVARAQKVRVLQEAAATAEFTEATSNFLALVAENGRLACLDEIIRTFKSIMMAYRGEVPCEVVTARPLDDESRRRLVNALKDFIEEGETVVLTARVDPRIIGGIVVTIGDRRMDMSVATMIKSHTD